MRQRACTVERAARFVFTCRLRALSFQRLLRIRRQRATSFSIYCSLLLVLFVRARPIPLSLKTAGVQGDTNSDARAPPSTGSEEEANSPSTETTSPKVKQQCIYVFSSKIFAFGAL